MGDISVRTKKTLLNEDLRWVGNGGVPIGAPISIILDRSAFDLVTAFPNGFLPSGITLGVISATGLYAPYVDGNSNGTQTMAGHLFKSVAYDRDSTGDISATLFWSGVVITNYLPTGHGLDTAGKTDVVNHIKYITNVV